jgi:hypothetical protein
MKTTNKQMNFKQFNEQHNEHMFFEQPFFIPLGIEGI